MEFILRTGLHAEGKRARNLLYKHDIYHWVVTTIAIMLFNHTKDVANILFQRHHHVQREMLRWRLIIP